MLRAFTLSGDVNHLITRILYWDRKIRPYDDPVVRYIEVVYYVVAETSMSKIHRKSVDTLAEVIVKEAQDKCLELSRPLSLYIIAHFTIVFILNSLYVSPLTPKELERIRKRIHTNIPLTY